MMKANVGCVDRAIRITVGLALIALAGMQVIGWWGWLGVIPLATGLLKFCPAYTLFGMKTCNADECSSTGSCNKKM